MEEGRPLQQLIIHSCGKTHRLHSTIVWSYFLWVRIIFWYKDRGVSAEWFLRVCCLLSFHLKLFEICCWNANVFLQFTDSFFYLFISNRDLVFTAKLISLSSGHTRQYENIITQSINLQPFYETSTGLHLQLVRCVCLKLLLKMSPWTQIFMLPHKVILQNPVLALSEQ